MVNGQQLVSLNMAKLRIAHEHDGYKKDVVRHFSEYPSYWKRVYNLDGHETNLKFQINRRRNVILQLLEELSPSEDVHILDLGCGAGGIANEILRLGYSVTCVDMCRPMLELARDSACQVGCSKSEYLQGDMERLPFNKDSFDIVICAGVLSFLPQDDIGVAEIARVLKPEGLAFITIPNLFRVGDLLDPYYLLRACRIMFTRKSRSGMHTPLSARLQEPKAFPVRRYVYGQLTKLFKLNGLAVGRTVSLGYGPVTIWRKKVLPDQSGHKLSLFLEKMADGIFPPLSFVANHWVVCVQKQRPKAFSPLGQKLLA